MQLQKDAKETRKIVLTGGHAATTALATVQEIVKRHGSNSWEMHFVGSKYAVEGERVPTLEKNIFPKLGVSFHHIVTGRLQRKLSVWSVFSLLKIPVGIIHAFILLLKIKPKIIVSFGGFAGFPVVLASWILGIPVILHEQTSSAGLANIYSSFFAKKIALARKESLKYFPKEKSQVLGNPVMSNILEVPPKKSLGNPPTIYITGGSRGSQTINNVIREILKSILKKYKVIHHTGYFDYEKFEKLRNSLPKKFKDGYKIYKWIDPFDIAAIYKRADLIISRAGANTASEIIVTKRPAILIPIPFSYKDEQSKNAQFASKLGLASVLQQASLTPKLLLSEIDKVFDNWKKIIDKTKNTKSPDIKAGERIVNLINKYLE